MPTVDYGNLGTIEFPDEMSNEDIQAYISANGETIKRDLVAKQRAGFESATIAESPAPSILDRLGAGFAAFNQGISQLPQGVLGAAGALSDALVPDELPDREAQSFLSNEELRSIRQSARELGGQTPGDVFRSAKAGVERFTEAVSPVDPRAEGFLNTDVPRGLGQGAAQLALGATTGGTGLAGQAIGVSTATAGEFTDAYERELARQVRDGEEPDTTKALLKSGLYSAAVAALESKLGIGRLIGQIGKAATENVAVTIAKNALSGGIEEASERAIQDLIVEGKTDVQGPLREGGVGAIVQGAIGIPGAVQSRRNAVLAEAGAVRAQRNLDRRRAIESSLLPSEPVTPEFEDKYAGPPVATLEQQTAQALKQAATQQRQDTRMKLADARQQGAVDLAQAAGVEAPQVAVVRPVPVVPRAAAVPVQPEIEVRDWERPPLPPAIPLTPLTPNEMLLEPAQAPLLSEPAIPNAPEIQVPQASPPPSQPVVAAEPTPEVPPETGAALGVGQSAQGGSETGVVPKVAVEEFDNGFRLSAITVPEGSRGKGIGTAFMRELIAKSDATGKPIYLTAVADTGQQDRLNKFYERLGFERYKDDPLSGKPMYRRMPSSVQPPTAKGGVPVEEKVQGKEVLATAQPAVTGPVQSTADRLISKIDEWDAQLKTPGVSSDPFFLRPQVRLVLQLAKGAIRAGQAISAAVRNAVRQARSQNPADDTRDSEIQTKLEDLLNGFSEPNAIGQIAEPIVARNEQAAQSLDEDALQADRRRQAWRQLRDLRDQAVQRALADNLDPRDVPTDVLSDEFKSYAAARGLDAEPVQEFLRFERKASNLATLVRQRESLVRLAETLRQANPRKYAENIEEYETMAGRMQLRINKAAETVYNGQSALERAGEINQSRATRIDRQAQRDALQHPEVQRAIVGPVEALRAIREEFQELQDRSPVEVLQDPDVDDDRKRMIAGKLDQAFREFGYSQQMVEDEVANERPKLEALINKLRNGLADSNDKRNYAEIAMDDARRARGGEHGLTGTLEDQEWLNWFNQNQGQLRRFAESLAKADVGNAPAQQLIEWITQSPVGAPPLVRNAAQGQYGVTDEVLSEILKALEASPAVRNAVAAIYSHGTKRIPAQVLAEIAQAASGGDTEYADRLTTELLDSQSSIRDAATARANELQGQLDDAQLRLKTLEEAANLFQRIASDPAFSQYKQAAELASTFTEQMVVANEDNLILKPFKADGIEQEGLAPTTKALESPEMFSERSLPAIAEYAVKAKAYVSGYDTALSAWGIDPIANPAPVTLGYDTATYNGLKDALDNELPALLDTANFFADQRVEMGGFNLFGQTNSFQRQILRSAQLIDGIFGSSLRKAMTEYSNARLSIGRVMANKEFRRLPMLLTRAMASHPQIGGKGWSSRIPLLGPKIQRAFAPGGNQEVYRREVFNPMADEGRKFGSRLAVGFMLPTGHEVTQADMDYLALNRKFNMAMLRVAQARPTTGTVVQVGGRELRRRAGSVGDYGLPRHLSPDGQSIVETIAGVYSDPKKNTGKITPSTDLTQNSTNPLVQMWNGLANGATQFLKYHVIDARRDDRAIAISPYMRQAYRSLADEMERGGYQGNITSLDDLVNRLVANFPQDTGLSVRDYVVEQLANELGGYAGLAMNMNSERKASMSRGKSLIHAEVESSNNEFTRPAAKLMMPSSLYDYGSVGSVDGLLAASRAAGERTVNLGLALQAAANEARQRISASDSDSSLLNPIDKDPVRARRFLSDVASIGDALSGDIGRDYTPPFFLFRWARSGFGLLAGLQLMSRVAQVTNIISAAVPEYLLMSRIHPAGKRFAALLVARNTASTIAKSTLRVAEKLTGLTGINSAGKWLKREHPKLYKSTLQYVEDIAERLWMRDVETVRGLGFSQSEAMMQSYLNALSEALQFSSENDELMRSGGVRNVGRAGRVAATAALEPVKIVAKALGFEFTDLMANVRALTSYRMIENIVRKSAIKWGDARKDLGEFDPADPRWSMTPEEYSTTPRIGPDEENSLAAMRQFMSSAGTSLESAMWDYYQRSQGGAVDVPVFGSAEDSIKRLVIGEINANMLTNRPQRAQSDPLASMFQILLGYSSNLSTQFLAAAKNVRGLTGMEKLAANFLKLVMGAIAALAIGLTQNFAVEFFSRGWLGRMSRNMTGLDEEFWKPDSRLPMRLAKPMLANVPFVGPFMLSLMQEQQGAKGAGDVASSIFAVGALSMMMTAVRAVIKLPAEDVGYALRKIVGPRVIPPIREAAERFTDNESQKYLNGVNSFYAAAENAGVLDPGRMSAGASRSNNEITPKSVINAKIRDASMAMQLAKEKGDTAGYDKARNEAEYQRDRLVKFEYDKIVEDATRRGNPVNEAKAMADARIAARRDYQDLNPVTSVLGHSPTQAEYDIIDGNLSGEREAAAKRTFSAFQGISDLFPDSKGRTTEPQIVKAARTGGGGSGGGLLAGSSRFAYSRPMLTSSRRVSAGARRSSLSSYRSTRRKNPRFVRARRGRVSARRGRR